MSRFPELFEEAIEGVVDDDAFLDRGSRRARREPDRRAPARARRRGADPRALPVRAHDAGDRALDAGDGVADRHRRGVARERPPHRRRRGGRHQRVPVRAGARARPRIGAPARGGLRRATTSSASSSSSRSRRTTSAARERCLVGTSVRVNAERLVELVEASMSSPIYELLKRPDELFVVEHAHLQPRFVEDSVRVALKSVARRAPRSRRRRLRALATGELRDDPRARGRRRALRHDRRAAQRARRRARTGRCGTRSCGTGCEPRRVSSTCSDASPLASTDVEVDERAWRLRKARTLVKVLALEPGRRLHREQVMELLWPELRRPPRRTTCTRRCTLPAALRRRPITLADGMLALDADVACDVERSSTAPQTRARGDDARGLRGSARAVRAASSCPRTLRNLGRSDAAQRCESCTRRSVSSSRELQPAEEAVLDTPTRARRRPAARACASRVDAARTTGSAEGRTRSRSSTACGTRCERARGRARPTRRAASTASSSPIREIAPSAPPLPVQLTSFVGRDRELEGGRSS